jgi:hypothetical protein
MAAWLPDEVKALLDAPKFWHLATAMNGATFDTRRRPPRESRT